MKEVEVEVCNEKRRGRKGEGQGGRNHEGTRKAQMQVEGRMDWTACPIDGILLMWRRGTSETGGYRRPPTTKQRLRCAGSPPTARLEGKERWRQLRMPRPPRSLDMWIVEPLESRLLANAGGLALVGEADFQPLLQLQSST